jgi:hypothetical protein
VDDGDSQPIVVEFEALGQPLLHRGVVHVPADGSSRRDLFELGQDRERRQIAGVQDQLRVMEELDARVRQASPSPRQVRVADDREQAAIILRART